MVHLSFLSFSFLLEKKKEKRTVQKVSAKKKIQIKSL